jgi:hypothetical protein
VPFRYISIQVALRIPSCRHQTCRRLEMSALSRRSIVASAAALPALAVPAAATAAVAPDPIFRRSRLTKARMMLPTERFLCTVMLKSSSVISLVR